MEEKVIRQHYIPQMYLRRFCDPDGQLYAFDLSTQKGLRNLPRAFAQKKFFYDLPPEEMHSILESMFHSDTPGKLEALFQTQVVEKMLSNIEGAANTVLDGFENGTLDFSDEDVLVKLVTFLHTLSARTIKPRSMMQRIHEQTVPILRQFAKNTDPSVDVYCNSTDDEYAKKLQIEQLLDPIQTAKFGVKLLENCNWYMGIVQSDIKLIISDNPAQMIDLGSMIAASQYRQTKPLFFV